MMRAGLWLRAISRVGVAALALASAEQAQADSYDHAVVGAGAVAFPTFQGADSLRILPTPVIDIVQGRFFAQVVGDGIGVNIVDAPAFQAGVGVALMLGYREHDVPDGIGELASTLGARAFVAGRIGNLMGNLSAVHATLGGDFEGVVANARLAYPLFWFDRLMVTPSLGVSWADGSYMRRYFGVNSEQAAASGLAPYRPSSSFKDVSARLAVNYGLTKHLGLVGVVIVTSNLDAVTDSPFVERRWQLTSLLAMTYTF